MGGASETLRLSNARVVMKRVRIGDVFVLEAIVPIYREKFGNPL